MANNLTYLPLDNIGLNGLNTQSNPTSLASSWLVKADNIAFKESGRITFRNGFVQQVMPSSAFIGSLIEHKVNGDYKIFAGVGEDIYTVDFTDPADAFPTATKFDGGTASDWQFVNFNKQCFGFQDSHEVVNYDDTETNKWDFLKNRTGKSLPSGITTFNPSCGTGYYGRLWVGGITEEKDVVHYSDTLIPTTWYNTDTKTTIAVATSYIIDSVKDKTTDITIDVGYKIKSFKELDTVTIGITYKIVAMCPEATVSDFRAATGNSVLIKVGDVYEADSTGALAAGCIVRRADWDNLGATLDVEEGDLFTATVTNADISGYGEVIPDWQVIGGPEIANVNDAFISKDILALLDITAYGSVVANYGLAGYIDLKSVWGTDEIVAIAPFYGKLVIFGKHNIAIYNTPEDPDNLELNEVIRGIGCVSRDSVQQVADDLFFLSSTGLRSLARTTELDKVPLTDMSVTIRDNIIRDTKSSSNIKGAYVDEEGLYILSFSDIDVVYVFDMKQLTPAKTPRVTTWNFKKSSFNITSLIDTESQGFLAGQEGGSIAKYENFSDKELTAASPTLTYSDQIGYTGMFQTTWIDLGEGVTAALLKKLKAVVGGGANTVMSVKWDRDFGTASTNALSTILAPPGTDFLYKTAKYSCNNDNTDNPGALGYDYTAGDMCVYEDDGLAYDEYVVTDYVDSTGEVATRNEGSGYYFCHPLSAAPANCESLASEYAGVKGLKEYNIPLSRSAKYVQFTFTAETKGASTVLQDLTLLFKRGKIR
jgi:hypothetical protein